MIEIDVINQAPTEPAPLLEEVLVRPATSLDLPAIVDFGLPILEQLGERSSAQKLVAAGTEHLGNPDCILLVACRGEEIVGVIGAQLREYFLCDRRDVFVDGVVVPPGERGNGVTRCLFYAAEKWARQRGSPHFSVSVPVKSSWQPSTLDGYSLTERWFRKDLL